MLHIFEARGNANHGASYALQYRVRQFVSECRSLCCYDHHSQTTCIRLQDMFDNGGPLERHMYFQWALYLLDLGRYDRITKFLEVNILPSRVTEPHAAPTLADATQLFWRLHFAGHDTDELRQQLYDAWRAISDDEQEQRVVFSPMTRLLRHVRCCVVKQRNGVS